MVCLLIGFQGVFCLDWPAKDAAEPTWTALESGLVQGYIAAVSCPYSSSIVLGAFWGWQRARKSGGGVTTSSCVEAREGGAQGGVWLAGA